jgi:uncharacterized RDD family membrane protein YckC
MTEKPPVPPPGVYPPLRPPEGSQSPSPGAGWPPPLGEPVDDLPTEAYASWIRRVGAFIIDQLVYLILVAILGLGGGLIIGAAGGSSRLEGIVRLILTLVILAYLIWNWGYRQGTTGSTIGKSVLKFKVVYERDGQPIGFGSSIVRYFAHFIDSITFGIGYLLPLLTAKRQTIADMIMSTVCLPNEPPSAGRSRTARPRIRMALGVVVLAIAAILTVLACLAITGHWVCTGGVSYPHCGPLGAHNFLDPQVLVGLVTALWTAGIFILRRYYGWAYALVPIAGIVANWIFSLGRYDWGWNRNYFAFLACVFVTTAVCVLIARGVTHVVAARQAEETAYRERKAARQQRMTPTLPPPGWYPDPAGDPRRQRHWDGRQWTDQWRYWEETQWPSRPS